MLRAVIGATEGAARLPSSGHGGIQSLLIGLLGFGALLALGYFGLKFLSRRGPAAGRGTGLRVLDRMAVSRESMILVVRVAGRILTVGVTKDGMSTLCELTQEEWEASPAPAPASPVGADPCVRPDPGVPASPVRGFWGRFAHNLGVYAGVLPKGTSPARPPSAPPSASCYREAAAENKNLGPGLQGQPPSENVGFDTWLHRAAAEAVRAAPVTARPAVSAPTAGPAGLAEPTEPTETEPAEEDMLPAPHRADYNAAIERMKQFGRMERPAQRTPLGGWIPPAPFGTAPPPAPAA
ncbi:MAG: flagellar biosynthetic protein FliO, partial [Oscillospiraceae bacterium]|nr:flagellar biosynthetic protein FliO [Oscillospiraceae bacterium]